MTIGKWFTHKVCLDCEHFLTDTEEMYSSGTCPHCGHTNDSTIVDSKKLIIRKHDPNKWYQIFKFNRSPYLWEGRDEFSKNWILKNKLPTL